MKLLIFLVLAVVGWVSAEIKLTEETRPVKVEKSDDLETGSSEHDLQASPYSYANAYGYHGGALGLYGNPFGYGGWYPYAQPYSHGLYGGYGGYGGYGAGYGGYGYGLKGYYPYGATSYSHRYQEHYPVYKTYGYGYPYYYGKYRSPYYGYGHAYQYNLGHYGGYGHGYPYGGYGGYYKR
ncbi:prisilkin-39 [Nilaparvata lugens]|uniref:prisilkin-39 n=1 Tax=Nilaparvata lugens TaxID=108931 RepID=UPI000B993B1E|nr:prisilkin-39 [Nilaparvata lugens]